MLSSFFSGSRFKALCLVWVNSVPEPGVQWGWGERLVPCVWRPAGWGKEAYRNAREQHPGKECGPWISASNVFFLLCASVTHHYSVQAFSQEIQMPMHTRIYACIHIYSCVCIYMYIVCTVYSMCTIHTILVWFIILNHQTYV